MKNYVYGFYASSGEFFELRENGFEDGKRYYVTAENVDQAFAEFVREIPSGHDMSDYIRL